MLKDFDKQFQAAGAVEYQKRIESLVWSLCFCYHYRCMCVRKQSQTITGHFKKGFQGFPKVVLVLEPLSVLS